MKQRKQATSASSCPFDRLPSSLKEIRRQEREAQRQARKPNLKAEVKAILTRLAKCCRSEGELLWPDKNYYARLNEAVEDLSRIARKGGDTKTLWNSYKVVDHHWPKLQLRKRIKDLVERANKNTPERPLVWFHRLGKQSTGEDAKRASEFVKLLSNIRSKKCEVALVDWRRYETVFLRFRNSHLRPHQKAKARQQLCPKVNYPCDQRLMNYTVFLEIYCEDAEWCRKHFEGFHGLRDWVWFDLQDAELLRQLERMFESADLFAQAIKRLQNLPVETRRKRTLELDARAHRRWRAKKSPQKT